MDLEAGREGGRETVDNGVGGAGLLDKAFQKLHGTETVT